MTTSQLTLQERNHSNQFSVVGVALPWLHGNRVLGLERVSIGVRVHDDDLGQITVQM